MRYFIFGLILVGFFVISPIALAQMSSTNFRIRWDSVNQGGADDSSSTNYLLRDTVGNAGAGSSSSSSYGMNAGYRQGIFDQIIDFDIEVQSNSTISAASSLISNTVTVGSTAKYSEGDMVVIIQDRGASAVYTMGRVISKTGTTLILDGLKDAGIAPVIDGTNDYVYRLQGNTAALGTLDETEVSTSVIGWEVTIDPDQEYFVYLLEDGELRDGANDIDDVSDGVVSAGSEEYGARSSDTSIAPDSFGDEDTAILNTYQVVAQDTSAVSGSKNFLVLKASFEDGVTEDGTYSQTLSFMVSALF